jgi:hypothetical protein
MPKRIANSDNRRNNEERKRWRDEVKRDLTIILIKTGRQGPGTFGNGGISYWKP